MTKPLTAEQIAEMQKAQTEKAEREAAGLDPIVPVAIDKPERAIESGEGKKPYTINLRPVDHLAAHSWARRHKTTFSGLLSSLIKAHLVKVAKSGEILNNEENAVFDDLDRERIAAAQTSEEIDKI